MRERVSWLYITCQCGLCKSPHEECGPTHQLLPLHTFHTTHWELNCTESYALFYGVNCVCKPFCEVISVSLHMSVITQNGYSALMMAARWGRTEVVSLLLEAKANTDLQNKVHVSIRLTKAVSTIPIR